MSVDRPSAHEVGYRAGEERICVESLCDHPQLRGAKQGSLVLSRWALSGRLTAFMSDAVVRDHAARGRPSRDASLKPPCPMSRMTSFPVTPAGWSSRLARFPTIPGWRFWRLPGFESFDPDPAKAKRLGEEANSGSSITSISGPTSSVDKAMRRSAAGNTRFPGIRSSAGLLASGALSLNAEASSPWSAVGKSTHFKGWLAHHRGHGLPSSMSWWSAKSRLSGRSSFEHFVAADVLVAIKRVCH